MMTSHNKHLAILLYLAIFTTIAIFTNEERTTSSIDDENGTESNGGGGVYLSGTFSRCKCLNGGFCIYHGLFCDCPVRYTGRFCQYWSGNHSCGSIQHADTFLDFSGNCRFCQCFNGTLNCDDTYTCEDLHDLREFLVDHNPSWNDAAVTYQHNVITRDLLLIAFVVTTVFVPILPKAIFTN